MTNTIVLRKKIDESGYKLKFIANKMGLTYYGFMNKLNNKTEFKASEIIKLCNILEINRDEKDTIFFAS